MAELTAEEISRVAKEPEAFELAADWHDLQESIAFSMGCDSSGEHHRARRLELSAEAKRLRDFQDNGSPSTGDGNGGR